MATTNPFDLLGHDDNDDITQLVQKLPPPVKNTESPTQAAKMPSKPLPPSQAVRESKTDGPRGGGRSGGRGAGRGGRGFDRDSANNENTYGNNNGYSGGYRPAEDGDVEKSSERRGGYGGDAEKNSERRGGYGGSRGGFRGGRRGGFNNGDGEEGERPRRVFDRRSGTGRGGDVKRDGSGRGNWGTAVDEITQETEEAGNETRKNLEAEKQVGQEDVVDANKENPVNETEEKVPEEDKEMTLEEYEKVLEEKRKALLAQKVEERKVGLDKELQSMQLLSNKKNEDEIFVKLGSEKDKRKEAAEKEERAKKSVTINEFLKPAEGERGYSGQGNRGRGRGRGGPRGGGFSGSYANSAQTAAPAPSIEDVNQFPTLGAK